MKKQLLALAGAAALGLGAVAGNSAPIPSDLTANVGLAYVYLVHPAPGTIIGGGATAFLGHLGLNGLPGTPGKAAVRVAARVAFVGARVGTVGGVGGMVLGAMIGAA